jgi:hypothetical protein
MLTRNYICGYSNKKKSNTTVLYNRLTDGGEVVRLTRRPRRKIPCTRDTNTLKAFRYGTRRQSIRRARWMLKHGTRFSA